MNTPELVRLKIGQKFWIDEQYFPSFSSLWLADDSKV